MPLSGLSIAPSLVVVSRINHRLFVYRGQIANCLFSDVICSRHWCPPRGSHHGPFWSAAHHPVGCDDQLGRCNTSVHSSQPADDLGRAHYRWLGSWSVEYVCSGLPGGDRPPSLSRNGGRSGSADDWHWVYRQHVSNVSSSFRAVLRCLTTCSWIGYGSLHAPDSSEFQWRFPLAFQAVPALLLVIGLFWFPESPRYLVEKEKYEAALKVLRKLHHDGTNDDWINHEFSEIKATIDAENSITVPGWTIMFKVPQWRKRLL